MKKFFLSFILVTFFSTQVFAMENCFIAKESDKVLKSEGDCTTQYPPQSTFKVPLSLIGFDSGLLKDKASPSWAIPAEADPFISVCKSDHNPRTWMRDSCVWYSRIITNKLGMPKLEGYITKFSYGNMDLSGGINDAWLSNSLKISPDEQTNFLQKVIDRKLPVSKAAYEKTKEIMFIQELPGGWKLYGKTGSATDHGWFVGYIEKGKRNIVFASHLVDKEKQPVFPSFRARNEALIKLWYVIDELEKQ